jgi:hypothetical protein
METFVERLFSGLIQDAQIGGLTFNTGEGRPKVKRGQGEVFLLKQTL